MLKIASIDLRVVDQVADQNELLFNKLMPIDVADTLYENMLDVTKLASKLADEDFALVCETARGKVRMFPIVDLANTVVSTAYYEKCASYLPNDLDAQVKETLKKKLIEYDIDVPESLEISVEKAASTPSSALEVAFGARSKEYYEEALVGLDPASKEKLASSLIASNTPVPKALEDYGNDAVGSMACLHIKARMDVLEQDKCRPYLKLAHVVDNSNTGAQAIAQQLYKLDIQNDITRHYGRLFPDAFASIRSGENKGLSKTASITTKLTEKRAALVDRFGESFVKELERDPATVIKSLPTPIRAEINAVIR